MVKFSPFIIGYIRNRSADCWICKMKKTGLSTNDREQPTGSDAENKSSRLKRLVKKFGIWGIAFFTVKGIISTALIYFLGKNFWKIIQQYFTNIF